MRAHLGPSDYVELCSWSLPAGLTGPRRARIIVQHELESLGLRWAIDDVALAVTELVDNVAEHTDCVGCRLVFARSEYRLRVGVEDSEPDEVADVLLPDPRRHKGLGLRIVEAVSTSWGCDVSLFHKSVWFEVPLVDSRPARASGRGRVPARDPDPTNVVSSSIAS